MTLKISLKNQLYALREIIFISLFYFGLVCFLYFKVEFELFRILFFSTLFFYLLVFLLPVLVLHINYLNKQNYERVSIEENKLIVGEAIYTVESISGINIYATAQHINNRSGAYTLPYAMYYYYVEIALKKGDKIILSSLLDHKIDRILKENFKTVEIIENPSSFLSLLIS